MEHRESREAGPRFLAPKEKKFIPATLNALLGVEKPEVIDAKAVSVAESEGMEMKEEFHVSVIASRNGKILKKFAADHSERKGFEDFIKEQFEKRGWEYRLLPEYYLLEKYYSRADLVKSGYGDEVPEHKRQTLIQKIELPDLEGFYATVNTETGLALPLPFPHVTLFSGSDYAPMAQRGIGVYSEKDFEESLKRAL